MLSERGPKQVRVLRTDLEILADPDRIGSQIIERSDLADGYSVLLSQSNQCIASNDPVCDGGRVPRVDGEPLVDPDIVGPEVVPRPDISYGNAVPRCKPAQCVSAPHHVRYGGGSRGGITRRVHREALTRVDRIRPQVIPAPDLTNRNAVLAGDRGQVVSPLYHVYNSRIRLIRR